jgi:hypothetical protein
MTKLPLPPSEEQMKLWFSLIEYDPDYVVLKKCNNRNGKNSNNNRSIYPHF